MMRAPANSARRVTECPSAMKLICIVTNCLNEEGNVALVFERIRAVVQTLPQCRYEHIVIDNRSNNHTVGRVKAVAARDKRVRLSVNTRNRLFVMASIR